jgi:hypothetical protein
MEDNWKDIGVKSNIDDLYKNADYPILDDVSEELTGSTLLINLEDINETAKNEAVEITERLSNYYFDQKYLDDHPYIENKIKQEINNIRRLLKMLSINETAQDALVKNITVNAAKASLYTSLTSLQDTTLKIQSQLNKLTNEVENIFREMQDNCDKTFEEKEKEVDNNIGYDVVRGSKEFIQSLINKGYTTQKTQEKEDNQSKQLELFG